MVEAKRLVTVSIRAIVLTGLMLLRINDTNIAIADASIPDNEVASSTTNTGDSSASATITMYAGDDE